jgi:hypothetical protein
VSGGGSIAIELSNSILIANDDFAVGGPIVPGGAVTTSIAYNDAFENVVGDYAPQLGASTGTNGNVAVDPTLDPLFVPPLCSATVDIGDPALDPADEPLPNGGRVNLGIPRKYDQRHAHLPGRQRPTARSTGSTSSDRGVVQFGHRQSAILHRGGPGLERLVDGLDLAYVTAFYAQSCP